tara:strand:+ start:463 stop:636 length:174 start_codon:yes stop_codon:yes gene_type:complete
MAACELSVVNLHVNRPAVIVETGQIRLVKKHEPEVIPIMVYKHDKLTPYFSSQLPET